VNARPRNVLVTGASTGIGREGARALMRAGYRVFAGVRKQRDVDALREDHLTPVLLDVTEDESVARALHEITAHTGEDGLYALVNNAGIAIGGPLEAISIDEVRAQFEVNVIGLLRVTQAFLPLLRRANAARKTSREARARIVNIGSMSGRIATPFLGPYCMSKFAVEAMTDALRMELLPFDIEVVVLEPGRVKTEIWAKGAESARTVSSTLEAPMVELYGPYLPGVVAAVVKTGETAISTTHTDRALLKALSDEKPRTHVPIAKGGRAVLVLKALFPVASLDRMVKKMMGFA
jgi:NAD(P)-dependent dehydrogenase (short-subunit alcohol dehydrogenase family)